MSHAQRKVLFSHRVSAGGRWYFFDVKEAIDGARYVSVSEARQIDGAWRRRRLLVFEDHLRAFMEALSTAVGVLQAPLPQARNDSVANARTRHPRAYKPWSATEDDQLLSMHKQGAPVAVLAAELQRQPSAIRSRLAKLTGCGRAGSANASAPRTEPEWRKLRPRAGRTWDAVEDAALLADFEAGVPLEEIAARRGRGVFSVEVRLCKLGRGGSQSERGTA